MAIVQGKEYSFICRDIGDKGESIGGTPGSDLVIFSRDFLPGEEGAVRITQKKKNYAVGKPVSFKKKSVHRIDPECKYFDKCGGCQLQHLDYREQLKLKKQLDKAKKD